jgi:hypothetical protein
MPSVLRLEVREFTDLTRWRWALTDASGAFLADREVRLDSTSWQYEAVTNLPGYISWHASLDERYAPDEARIVDEVGAWLGEQVLGASIAKALITRRPATVQVIIPPGAEALAFLPLEIAHAAGKPLAQHDITLVIRPATTEPAVTEKPAAPRDRLRVLGLFSLPEGGQPLNLRRERHALVRLISGIAARGRAAEVRVLQYGVTRDRLREVLEEADGWDIIHVSGHGRPGELLLETAGGRPDLISAADLADLLDVAREHVRLITLAACWSASLTAAQQRRLLRLPVPADQTRHAARSLVSPDSPPAPGTLATELAGRLGCAVLAMRYPVDDEFAIGLSGKLYDLLAAKGQPLPRAVAMTLRQLANGAGGRAFPALSMAAPAIFGEPATELTLAAPKRTGPPSYRTEDLKMAGFPPQPHRFVGRTGVMARASAALAGESGVPGMLLHGMPGGGKTACALELAYGHEHDFERLVWFKAPDEGMEISGALTDFALTLERYLDGFQMIHVLTDDTKLNDFLPRLTELMERNRLLIVLDNAESLLTDSGRWRDDWWGRVLGALTRHDGLGRVIVTSRRVSAETSRLRVETVDALSADEALLLARELPHLRTLIHGEVPGMDAEVARKLALGVLSVAQGHPKLLGLADGQAAQPDTLATLVEAGDQAWREQGGLPDGFFTAGETSADPSDYLGVLAAWTGAVTDTLSAGERDLFWFLCCLEEPDRIRPVLDGNWEDLWHRLGRDGQPPELGPAIAAIAARGLISVQRGSTDKSDSYAVHPGVAAAGRDHAGTDFQDATDTGAAAYWHGTFDYASGENAGGTVDTRLIVRAGLAAVPYLLRRQQWGRAGHLLESAFIRDSSRANAAALLPAIEEITRHDPRRAITLARVLLALDPAAGERRVRAALDDAAARGDHKAASQAAGNLVNLCHASGRLAEALTLAGQMADHTRQAGLGPWTQLADEVQRLQVLTEMNQAGQVLADVQRLREHMDTLPAVTGPDEAVPPWNVRETLLDTGRRAAHLLGQWQDALDLNAAQTASHRARYAPAADTARSRFNDYFPLLKLGRTSEALDLLLECRQVFHEARDIEMLGKTLGALADTEDKRGHGDAAIRLERDALRHFYLAGDLTCIAVSYYNLGNYLGHHHAHQPAPALTSHLVCALIHALTSIDGTDRPVRAAAADLRNLGAAAVPPANIADLRRMLGDIPGTDPAALIAQLSPDPETAERTLQDLIVQVQALAWPQA